MRFSFLPALALAATVFTAIPALAQSRAVPHEASEPIAGVKPALFGKWALMPMTSEFCQAIGPFDGGIYLSMGENEAGSGKLVLIAERFDFAPDKPIPGTLSLDGWKTSKPVSFDPVRAGSGTWMLAISTDPGFLRAVSASKRLAVRVPGAQLDAAFDIPEIADVVSEIHYCNARMAAAK